MTNENGRVTVDQLKNKLVQHFLEMDDDDSLLRDWKDSHRWFRSFLLGAKSQEAVVMPGQVRIWRDPLEIVVQLASAQFRSIAKYRGDSVPGIFEIIENDLETATTPWEPDWQSRRSEARKHTVE